MSMLKVSEIFVTIDKFQQAIVKEVGFLVGLHTKLVNWDEIQRFLQTELHYTVPNGKPLFEIYWKVFGYSMGTSGFGRTSL